MRPPQGDVPLRPPQASALEMKGWTVPPAARGGAAADEGETVKVVRAILAAVIVVNLALLAAWAPLRATLLRYETARQRRELAALALENRALLHQAAMARRPDRLASRAAALGVDLRAADLEAIVKGRRR